MNKKSYSLHKIQPNYQKQRLMFPVPGTSLLYQNVGKKHYQQNQSILKKHKIFESEPKYFENRVETQRLSQRTIQDSNNEKGIERLGIQMDRRIEQNRQRYKKEQKDILEGIVNNRIAIEKSVERRNEVKEEQQIGLNRVIKSTNLSRQIDNVLLQGNRYEIRRINPTYLSSILKLPSIIRNK